MQVFADKTYKNPIRVIEAFDNESFKEAFSQIEDLRKRLTLIGYIRYEAKDIFFGKKIKSKFPLLYFEAFENAEEFSAVDSPNDNFLKINPRIDYQDYELAINKIKNEIAEGNTYQVNYTYDYNVGSELDGYDLFKRILPHQVTPYNAYIKNKYEEILSFSPELFFELKGNIIKTKPMKGTVKRGKNENEDKNNIEFLKNDIKNRAENVMIVDLLRNDLGKIAKTGTVKVDKLFEIESHQTVHQMTSEITAELDDGVPLYEIFKAIFPCGSVTGAPKINTMKIIDEIENGKRNVYCGAIGLISPEKTVFSVPIRILQKIAGQKDYTCRVGGAIVWDSTARDEWEETLTKIKFLSPSNRDFELVETILVKNEKMLYKDAHFARMKKSAKELGFKFNKDIFKISPEKDGILRVLLSMDGGFKSQYIPLNKITTNKVFISKRIINSNEPLLYHKTTYRPWYEEAMQKIESNQIFDEIFVNQKGEITEGARSNIILKIDREMYTPPVKCGLLNGIGRQRQKNKLIEKILKLEDLKKAEKVFCINSVRGIIEVQVDIN